MWNWWQKNALLTSLLATVAWAVLLIVLDVLVLALQGRDFTISWQMRMVSIANRVIPAVSGFLAWGFAFHFWRLYERRLFDPQPIHDWFVGGVLGAIFVSYCWLQRP